MSSSPGLDPACDSRSVASRGPRRSLLPSMRLGARVLVPRGRSRAAAIACLQHSVE
jgi:hypothetical protein